MSKNKLSKSTCVTGQSPKMQAVFECAERTADKNVPILISGAPGSGRTHMAGLLHQLSKRSDKPYIHLCCRTGEQYLAELVQAIYENSVGNKLESLWLKHIHAGATLVLEDIEHLSNTGQANLEVLCDYQNSSLKSIGMPERIVFGMICTTVLDLAQHCVDGKFSTNLYYRLNLAQIELPTLEERIEDLPHICASILSNISKRHKLKEVTLTADALNKLRTHKWHHNLRELSSVLERTLLSVTKDTKEILADDLNLEAQIPVTSMLSIAKDTSLDNKQDKALNMQAKDEAEDGVSLEDYFQNFVLRHQNTMSETELAHKLGISRKCLWERRQRFGITRKTGVVGQES